MNIICLNYIFFTNILHIYTVLIFPSVPFTGWSVRPGGELFD